MNTTWYFIKIWGYNEYHIELYKLSGSQLELFNGNKSFKFTAPMYFCTKLYMHQKRVGRNNLIRIYLFYFYPTAENQKEGYD